MYIQQAAQQVAAQAQPDEQEVFIDPITISVVCAILGAVFQGIRLYCELKRNRESANAVIEVCKRPDRRQRRWVRKVVAQHASNLDNRQRDQLTECVLRTGANATPEQVQACWAEAEQGEYGEFEV